jgi:hypothetical protein
MPKGATMQRILESTVATLVGGFILWWLTVPASQPAPMPQPVLLSQSIPMLPSAAAPAETLENKTTLSVPTTTAPPGTLPSKPETAEPPAPAGGMSTASPASTAAVPPPAITLPPDATPVGTVLLYENFARYQEGQVTDWGPNASTRIGLDRRKWLVPNAAGTFPVGHSLRLPRDFYLEFRYSAGMSDVTRGILGWWKDPIATTIAFVTDRGVRHEIRWVIGCGNDVSHLRPLGSPTLYARKYYHTIQLPGATANEVGVVQPTGMLRINWDNGSVGVLLDNQAAAAGTISPGGQIVGFEVNVVKGASGTLSFTDFKIAR